MTSLPWFRMYHEFAGDPVIQALSFDDQRHFVMVLCFKASGLLDRDMPSQEVRHRLICKALGLDPLAGGEALKRLSSFGLVDSDWQPVAWDRRQFKSDNSTARVQKFRSTQSKKEEIDHTETDTEGNVTSNVSETLHIKRAARMAPKDFEPSRDLMQWAATECPGVDLVAETRKFKDHTFATARSDWPATWRNWIRRATPTKPVRVERKEPTPEEVSAARKAAAEANKRELERKVGPILRAMP